MKPYMNAVISTPYAQIVECNCKQISILATLAAGGKIEFPIIKMVTRASYGTNEGVPLGSMLLATCRIKRCCDLIDNNMAWDINYRQKGKSLNMRSFLLCLQEEVDVTTNGLSKTNGKFFLLINPFAAKSLASHPEMRKYLNETPSAGREALESIWGLPQRFAGVYLYVEQTPIVTNTQSAEHRWAKSDCPILLYVDKPYAVQGEPSFSTLQVFHYGDLPEQTGEYVAETTFESLTNANTGFMLPDLLEE